MSMLTPREVADSYAAAGVAKAKSPAWRLLLLGIAAGMFVGFGAAASSTAVFDIHNVGIARFLAALIFPIGLCMVVVLGAELFTGNVTMVTSVLSGRISWRRMFRNWAIVYVGNCIGAMGLASLLAFFGQFDIGGGGVAVYAAKAASAKASLPWMNAFVLGIFCNVLVCVAAYLGGTARETGGRLAGLFLPIVAFVTCGFEHCVANMFYIPAGIFATMNPAYADMIVDAGINTAVLNFGTFVTANLIPVTLGNIVGGLAVGLFMYFAHATRRTDPDFPAPEPEAAQG